MNKLDLTGTFETAGLIGVLNIINMRYMSIKDTLASGDKMEYIYFAERMIKEYFIVKEGQFDAAAGQLVLFLVGNKDNNFSKLLKPQKRR